MKKRIKRNHQRVYRRLDNNSLAFGHIDLRNGVVIMEDGEEFKPEEIFEKFRLVDNCKPEKWIEKEIRFFNPITGEVTCAIHRIRKY